MGNVKTFQNFQIVPSGILLLNNHELRCATVCADILLKYMHKTEAMVECVVCVGGGPTVCFASFYAIKQSALWGQIKLR